jgi:hypothetical protein
LGHTRRDARLQQLHHPELPVGAFAVRVRLAAGREQLPVEPQKFGAARVVVLFEVVGQDEPARLFERIGHDPGEQGVECGHSRSLFRQHQVPLPSRAQFLNVIESVFSGMAKAIIDNSDDASVEEAKAAIDRHFAERNAYYQENPRRAGGKIWGTERVPNTFREGQNCKDPRYR